MANTGSITRANIKNHTVRNLQVRNFLQINWGLLLCTILLSIIGLVNIYSASSISSADGIYYAPYFNRQIVWIGIGFMLIGLSLFLDYHRLEVVALAFYCFVIFLLLLVHVIGFSAGGAKRWIDLGFITFQPSELAKFSTLLLAARMLARDGETLTWFPLLKIIGIAILPFLLVLTQPDLGTSLIIMLILAGMVLYHGVKWQVLRVMLIAIPAIMPLMWFMLKDYQKQRILTFLDPTSDPLGSGYHIIQSQIAIGSGEIAGKGFQGGTQSQFRFLPEKHTDFAMAVLGEEWGFVGTFITVSLFCIFLYCIFASVRDSKDRFGSLLCAGIFFYFFWQILINICMVVGLAPVVGMPLAFLSYGGSAMLVNCALVGIVLNVSVRGSLLKD